MNKLKFVISLAIILFQFAAPTADAFAAEEKPAASKKAASGVAFNFVDVELPAVVKFISEVTGRNFIFDETLKGKVTIIAPTKLTEEDAFRLFSAILEVKGFAILPSGVNAFKIVPQASAKEGETPVLSGTAQSAIDETYVARLIQLENISAREAVTFLKPLASKNAHLAYFGPGNLLLVVDSEMNIGKLMNVIKLIDLPTRAVELDLVQLQHANAANLAIIITDALFQQSSKVKKPEDEGRDEFVAVVPDERLNALILIGSNKARKDQIKELIALLDRPLPDSSGKTKVYPLQYANADELAPVLLGLAKAMQTDANSSKQRRQARTGAPPSVDSGSIGNVVIVPHVATNSLVITAAPSDYANMVTVIKQLDIKRRQVFVEAMIAEVSINKLQDLGTKWRAAVGTDGYPAAVAGVGQVDAGTMTNIISGLSGLTIGGAGNMIKGSYTNPSTGTATSFTMPGYAAIFNVNEFRNTINILSSPNILTSDNQEAEIHVGENVPIISKQDTTTAGITSNIIERKDVGIRLKLTPKISDGEYVSLDIYQEISAVPGAQSENIITKVGPSITTRSAKTSVVVKDGETIVIGGLIRENETETLTKVPLLGDIPVLGWLFKFRSKSKEKTNLLIFLTPRIVRDAEDMRNISAEKMMKYQENVGKDLPEKKSDETSDKPADKPADKTDTEAVKQP
ncbi:MAG: type II secretion system secretin GspD [Nitrospirae bacterium]|nr:type II secretion system secretin GspD [Nitrospirota bacterium]